MTARAVVVGAGAGGLAAALDLSARGLEVTVLERAATVGGKIRQLVVGGRGVDVGPTVLTMRWVLDELWALAGGRLEEDVRLRPLAPIARHFWSDGSQLDLHGDVARDADAIGALAGAREAAGYRAFREYGRRIFDAVERPFLRAPRPGLSTLLGTDLSTLAGLLRIDARRTLWQSLGDFFADRRLRQLFARYATYAGSSPWQAPATLNVIAEVEQRGVFRVEGGMVELARALSGRVERAGARVRCGVEVEEVIVERGRATGVRLAGGDRIDADVVVLNADVRAVAAGRFGAAARRAAPDADRTERSASAMTWAIWGTARGAPLAHHDVFFSDDYEAEMRALWIDRVVPAQPTIYVCAQDRADVDDPRSAERLFVLVNAPADGDRPRREAGEQETWRSRIFTRLEKMGLSIEPAAPTAATTPAGFEALYPSTGGALYGPASHGWKAAFAREGARSRIPGLYFAGGAVHPGAGVPMAMLSGRRAAEAIWADLASRRRSRPAATPGTTWTSSPTTASGRSS